MCTLQARKDRDLLASRVEALEAELERERGLHRRELRRRAKEQQEVRVGRGAAPRSGRVWCFWHCLESRRQAGGPGFCGVRRTRAGRKDGGGRGWYALATRSTRGFLSQGFTVLGRTL